MNKLTVALITGIAVAGLTSAGFSWKTRWTRQENAALRAENDALRQLKAARGVSDTGVGPTLGQVADADKLTQLVSRVAARNTNLARKVAAEPPKAALQNRGMGAPMEAIETFAWACSMSDVRALAKQLYFDGKGRERAVAKLAEMPPFLRDQYKTPEELYAFFIAADCLVAPPPADAALLEKVEAIFLKSDRIEMRAKGASHGRQQYQWTAEGWKYALPEQAVDDLAEQVLRTNPVPAAEPATP